MVVRILGSVSLSLYKIKTSSKILLPQLYGDYWIRLIIQKLNCDVSVSLSFLAVMRC